MIDPKSLHYIEQEVPSVDMIYLVCMVSPRKHLEDSLADFHRFGSTRGMSIDLAGVSQYSIGLIS